MFACVFFLVLVHVLVCAYVCTRAFFASSQDAKMIIVCPNIEEGPSEGGLDSKVSEILRDCRNLGVPIVFALSRNRLGKAVGKVS